MAKLIRRGKVWYSDIRIGGHRIQRALNTDRRIAEGKLADLIDERNARRHGDIPQNIAWEDWKKKYFALAAGQKAELTLHHERSAVRKLEARYPIQRLRDITPELLGKLQADWRGDGYKPGTINRQIRAIRTIVRQAEALGYATAQKWDAIKRIKEPRGKLLFYTMEELERLLKVCRGVWRTVCMLGARAGLRRAEIYWLSWDDIDFEKGRLHVSPKEGWTPKDNERRWLKMPPDLVEYLKPLKGRRTTGWVLEDEGGRPSLAVMSVYFRQLTRKAGLKGGIHTLRHTFGSHLIQRGASLKALSELLGHANTKTTEIYSHLAPDSPDQVITLLPPLKNEKAA